MFNRNHAVLLAVASLLASSGFANADTQLSLNPSVIKADDVAVASTDRAPGMWALDRVGAAQPLDNLGLNIYGWVEAGYTYNHRHGGDGNGSTGIVPGPFNHEVGNHFMLNQVDIRFERRVDTTKFDVGGMVEVQYGTDAGFVHSTGMPFNGNDPSDNGIPADTGPDKYRANYQFDVTQAYLDVNIPVGNGLKVRAGKFVTLLGYETIDPRGDGQVGNPFYSHSWAFGALPFTQTGILGFYKLNDQWSFIGGVTRGWDQTLEDSGPAGGTCAIDGLGQIAYTPNQQLAFYLNWSVGPQNFGDNSHYRTAINPIATWQVSEQLKLGLEGLYIYDGGLNGDALGTGITHAYGDVWGATLYASYKINDYVTANGRFEKFHSSGAAFGPLGGAVDLGSVNVYAATLGVTIVPLPKDPLGKNISVRPEIRYDWSEDSIFAAQGRAFQDQLTFAADVIVKF